MNTEREKQYIIEQRVRGRSFVQIGRDLGRSADSVRSAFNRATSGGGGPAAKQPIRPASVTVCKYCGAELHKAPGGEKRLFCSDRCRNAWGNERKRRIPYTLICEHCGREFMSFGNPHRRFCSRKCFAELQKAAARTEVLYE